MRSYIHYRTDKNCSNGFTLAEVLITLGIIGVVAALTIPTLIQNHKKKVTVTQLKSTYSILTQAVDSAKIEHGDISTWDFELDNADFAKKYVLPYLKVVKTISGLDNAWRLKTLSKNGTDTVFISWAHNPDDLVYIISNGAGITVKHFLDLRMDIVVDINGAKGPNEIGTDGFVFEFSKANNQIVPVGITKDRNTLLNNSGGYGCIRENNAQYYQGTYCGALIMMDGWQISKEYPWK